MQRAAESECDQAPGRLGAAAGVVHHEHIQVPESPARGVDQPGRRQRVGEVRGDVLRAPALPAQLIDQRLGALRVRAQACSASWGDHECKSTAAPSAASRRAIAAPIAPRRLAPVTSTTRPLHGPAAPAGILQLPPRRPLARPASVILDEAPADVHDVPPTPARVPPIDRPAGGAAAHTPALAPSGRRTPRPS